MRASSTRDGLRLIGVLLDPQEGNTYEAGIKSSFLDGLVTGSAAVYQIRQDNLAEPDPGHFIPGTTNTASRPRAPGRMASTWNSTARWPRAGT